MSLLRGMVRGARMHCTLPVPTQCRQVMTIDASSGSTPRLQAGAAYLLIWLLHLEDKAKVKVCIPVRAISLLRSCFKTSSVPFRGPSHPRYLPLVIQEREVSRSGTERLWGGGEQ